MRPIFPAVIVAIFLAGLLSCGCTESAGASLSPRQAEIAPGVWAQRLTGSAFQNDDERQIDLVVVFRSDATGRDAQSRYRSIDNTAALIGQESIDGAKQTVYELEAKFLEDEAKLWDQTFDLKKGRVFILDRTGRKATQHDLTVADLKDPALVALAAEAR